MHFIGITTRINDQYIHILGDNYHAMAAFTTIYGVFMIYCYHIIICDTLIIATFWRWFTGLIIVTLSVPGLFFVLHNINNIKVSRDVKYQAALLLFPSVLPWIFPQSLFVVIVVGTIMIMILVTIRNFITMFFTSMIVIERWTVPFPCSSWQWSSR